ncbi:MAG: PorT family protein [Bacteroidia bacterium]|nr:PorT family protein [Bacteroidia bacterium]
MNSQSIKIIRGREKYFFCALFFCAVQLFSFTGAEAQLRKVQNIPKYDKQRVHFGFALGFTSPDFRVTPVPEFKGIDSVYDVQSEAQLGFLLGIVTNMRIGEYFDLRFVPILTFAQRNLNYSLTFNNIPQVPVAKKVESTFLEFPLMLKYKSARINNYRAYVIGGAKYSMDLVSQAKVESNKEPVRLQPYDYGYEIGFGFDFYLTYFKFALEIKMYKGVNNLLVKDEFIYSRSLERLHSQIFYISLLFE